MVIVRALLYIPCFCVFSSQQRHKIRNKTTVNTERRNDYYFLCEWVGKQYFQ